MVISDSNNSSSDEDSEFQGDSEGNSESDTSSKKKAPPKPKPAPKWVFFHNRWKLVVLNATQKLKALSWFFCRPYLVPRKRN